MPLHRPLSLKARALQWLAQREHSRSELRRKLLRAAQDAARRAATADADADADDNADADPAHEAAARAAEVDALLDSLQAQRLLSEQRFVESRVNARAGRFGNLRIRHELAQHGSVLDAQTAAALAASEFDRARAVWLRKFGGPPADAAARAKQMRFLAGRGFSADTIRRVLAADED